jgi:hypothetical protein
VLGNRDVYPGSQIPIKNFNYFNPKKCFQALGNMIWVVHPGSGTLIRVQIYYPSRILDPDPQHCILEEKYFKVNNMSFLDHPYLVPA